MLISSHCLTFHPGKSTDLTNPAHTYIHNSYAMRTFFSWNSEDTFLKNKGKAVCATTENESESTVPLLNMDSSNMREGKSEDGVAKSTHVKDFTSPSRQSVTLLIPLNLD